MLAGLPKFFFADYFSNPSTPSPNYTEMITGIWGGGKFTTKCAIPCATENRKDWFSFFREEVKQELDLTYCLKLLSFF